MDLTKQDRANNNQPQSADVAAVTSGCNADMTNIFLAGGSLLANVGSRMSIPASHIDLIRGLVGDVQLEGSANAYRISAIPPCPQNNPDDIKAFTEGRSTSRVQPAPVARSVMPTGIWWPISAPP